MSTPGASGLMVIGMAVLTAATQAQTITGFFPSTIFMSGPEVTSFLVTNATSLNVSLAVITDTTTAPVESCNGTNNTDNWASTHVGTQTNVFKVTVTSKKNLTRCAVSETNCCTEDLCVVETLQITACENDRPISSLLIHAEIYINTTFVGLVSDNKTVIPNQIYQPLGSCPCNLTAGACDILCCCDQECNSSMKALFNGSCYSGIFGGNVSPPFDQLCSVQEKNHAPDWFPFLCVQSSMDNSPFLGYFYQGDTRNPSQTPSFNLSFQSIVQTTINYKEGNPILMRRNGFGELFTLPQKSTIGKCVNAAPVAYLQDFNVSCVADITSCSDVLTVDLNVQVNSGNEVIFIVLLGLIIPTVQIQNTSVDIVNTGAALSQAVQCDVIVSADYTFIWNANVITEIRVSIVTANISLTHQAQLSQRFTTTFLTRNSTTNVLSGNPGYQVGKPVIVGNGTIPFNKSTLKVWKPVGESLCSTAGQTPVLFGQNVFSGCLFEVVGENCTRLREKALQFLRSLITVDHIAMRGNSNVSDPSEWASIMYDLPSTTCTGNCAAENVMCLKVPSNMNIEIITAVTGAVEGIPQEEILAAKVSFSTINVECVSACNLSLPLTNSVQFIQVPAQPLATITRFQTNYTEYDCEKNDVCWQQLAYPLTIYYTGEPYHLTLAKGMILVFFFISAAILGGPWNRICKAWNNTL
ncbi:PREDICTED: tectonic-2 [Nanorana parkeri]|uniref:tectonic-2 n=1 Tax=Nanorana parkeri TaxID=125878 RepID=UPI000854E157|nr:PREDICTED: tectonic-2 [Nanorana parkeri]